MFGSKLAPAVMETANKLTHACIEVWSAIRTKMLPTPSRFHYIFSMRDISRVFQGVLDLDPVVITTGGSQDRCTDERCNLLRVWKHECQRVFQDKLVSTEDRAWCGVAIDRVVEAHFGDELARAVSKESFYGTFFQDDVYDADGVSDVPRVASSPSSGARMHCSRTVPR